MAQGGTSSKFDTWRRGHDAEIVRTSPLRTRWVLLAAAIAWYVLAGTLVYAGLTMRDSGALVIGVCIAALGSYELFLSLRFRIAEAHELTGDALSLSGKGWSVELSPADVRAVRQSRRHPYGGVLKMPGAAWGAWIRIDAVGAGRRGHYLVWEQDSCALLARLRAAGYPIVGDVIPVPQPRSASAE